MPPSRLTTLTTLERRTAPESSPESPLHASSIPSGSTAESVMRVSDPLIWTIRGYQHLISRFTPPVCRFHPSCSHYAVEALQVHGAWRGSLLAANRIGRCNPFFPGGFDPVPPRTPPPEALETDNEDPGERAGGAGED